MTKSRAIQCVVAFGIAWLLQVGVCFAEADWFDRASGPGPFKGFFLHYRFLCVSRVDKISDDKTTKGNVSFTPLRPWERTATGLHLVTGAIETSKHKVLDESTPRGACLSDNESVRGYFEVIYRRAVSLENDLLKNQAKVHVVSWEIAYANRFSRAFDFSLGMGINYIDPRRRGWDGELDAADTPDAFRSFERVSVTPSIKWAPIASAGHSTWAHFITVQAGAAVFLRGFHARDFCNTGATACVDPAWQTHGADVIPMARVLVDWSQLWRR